MEYEKEERRKLPRGGNSYHLKRQEENRGSELTGYEPEEREKRYEAFPKEQLAAETEDGFLSGGFVGEKEAGQAEGRRKMVLMVSLDNDDRALLDEKRLKKEGARRQKVKGKPVYTNSPEPKKSAALLEMDAAKSRERLLNQLEAAMEKTDSRTMSEIFPYLKGKELREQIHALEEEAREHSRDEELVRDNRAQAAYLREDLQKQEQEKRRLLKLLETRLEQPEEKKPRFDWERLAFTALAAEPEAGDDGADGEKPEAAAAHIIQ